MSIYHCTTCIMRVTLTIVLKQSMSGTRDVVDGQPGWRCLVVLVFKPATLFKMGEMMNHLSLKRFMMAFAVALAVSAAWAGQIRAQAFTITSTTGLVQEVIGDKGGTAFANAPNSTAGQGLPTANGGWANGPGFAPDPSFFNNLGISGFSNNGAPLIVSLNSATTVRFTWFGKGDSSLQNSFQVDSG